MQRVKREFTEEEYAEKMAARRQTVFGHELPDPTPVAPPVGYIKQPSMIEQVRNMVRSEHLRLAALEAGQETFEEADDFDIPDDPVDPHTRYEAVFDPPIDSVGGVGDSPPPVAPREAAPIPPVDPASPPAPQPSGSSPAPKTSG